MHAERGQFTHVHFSRYTARDRAGGRGAGIRRGMSSEWTTDRVVALAPDGASASAGQGLASIKKWARLERSERAIWGLCQGSGKDPYQSRVDLAEPAFKCSCPSRKFPCKHGLGLLLLYAKDGGSFKVASEPGWVSEWIAGRAEKAEKKVERAKAAADKPVDAEAQAKRAAQREARVRDGVAECRVWIEDLVRRGLVAARGEESAFWERAAARMVDAQAPGLAGMIRRLPEVMGSGEGWEARTLSSLGRVYLLLAGAERLDTLPAALAGDIRTALGWAQSKDEAIARDGVTDRWVIAGQVTEEEDRLKVRRTWLIGRKSARRALVLDFAAGGQPLDASLVAGFEFDGEVVYYPSRVPQRAIVKSRGDAVKSVESLEGAADATIDASLTAFAAALAENPWLARWPIALTAGTMAGAGERWWVVDAHGAALPVRGAFAVSQSLWKMVSLSAGRAVSMIGEWDGESLLPISLLPGPRAEFADLAPRWVA